MISQTMRLHGEATEFADYCRAKVVECDMYFDHVSTEQFYKYANSDEWKYAMLEAQEASRFWQAKLDGFEYGLKVGSPMFHVRNLICDCFIMFDTVIGAASDTLDWLFDNLTY